jgi:ribosomal 50S subunit-recycling heat shock protein
MRLDKFLKVSRLIKRRTVANDACDAARIFANGKAAKASYNVKLGDEITVAFGSKSVTVRVMDIKDTTKKAEAVGMYEVISESNS